MVLDWLRLRLQIVLEKPKNLLYVVSAGFDLRSADGTRKTPLWMVCEISDLVSYLSPGTNFAERSVY
jgi:hypothetical protein